MASLDECLKDPEYTYWVKSGLALNITNEVLRPFVVKEIKKLHQSIKDNLPTSVWCGGCRINAGCSTCNAIQREIENKHWYSKPSFTNTCTRRWSTEPWEIAKCYMPPSDGYRLIADSDADFSACINVVINCKHFQAYGTSDPRGKKYDVSKSKDFRNEVMHSVSQKVSEQYMKENLNILINILNKFKTTENEDDTKEAIEKIQEIKAKKLTITLEDVIEVRITATKAVEKDEDQVQRDRLLVNFEAGCRKALCKLTEDIIQKGNLSVTAFLSKIANRKDLCSSHQNMLFPKTGTHADIREWDLFVYCFMLEELDLYEPKGNFVSLFVGEVQKIRNRLLFYPSRVTQNDLSELCKNLIDTDLNTEITEIFNKDAPDVDVIRSFNILASWWREEKDYGKKPGSKKQTTKTEQAVKEFKETHVRYAERIEKLQSIIENLKHEGENVTLQDANAAEPDIDADCELRVRGCDEETEEALQKHITSLDNNDFERNEAFDHFFQQKNLRQVNPEEGSIILNVKCSSIAKVIDFWDSCFDGRTVEALSEVRDYYRRYFKCDTLEFDVILTKKGVSRCVNEIVEGLSARFDVLLDNATYKQKSIKTKESLL